MIEQQRPSKRTAKRAAQIWVSWLRHPNYDVGLEGLPRIELLGLAALQPSNANDETLARFADELEKLILTPSSDDPNSFENADLHVDYEPCNALKVAADRAGLKMEFPYKTSVDIYESYLVSKAGYGAFWEYHYALDNGKWLVTTLTGSDADVAMIRSCAVNGTVPAFRVED